MAGSFKNVPTSSTDRLSGVRKIDEVAAAPVLSESDAVISLVQEETREWRAIITLILNDPLFAKYTAELSTNVIHLTMEAQKRDMTAEIFDANFRELRAADDERPSRESLYFTNHLSKWLMGKTLLRQTPEAIEEAWQIISCSIPELNKKNPTVGIKKSVGNPQLATISIYEVFKGLHRYWRSQAKDIK